MFIKHNNYTGALRVEDLKCALDTVRVTHSARMRKIDSLRNEILDLLDHIAVLKKAEAKYLASLGFSIAPSIDEQGNPTRSMYLTASDMGTNSRSNAPSRVVNSKFEDYSNPYNRPKVRPGEQDSNIAMNEAVEVLRNEDSTARRYNHKILDARLKANLKRLELEKLLKEQSRTAGEEEREDG